MKCKYWNCSKEAVKSKSETRPSNFCSKQCMGKYCSARRQKQLKYLSIEYKGGKCQVCGYNKCRRALEFHHRDPKNKLFTISSNKVLNWEKIKKELDKCDLLCANCHREVEDDEIKERAEWFDGEEYSIWFKKNKEKFTKKKCECGKIIERRTIKCRICARKAVRPSKEELEKLLWEMPTTHIAKKYNVSDKAIEKWAKNYNISKPPRGYWQKLKAGLTTCGSPV